MTNSVGPYLLGASAMFLTIRRGWPFWATLLIALPTSGFLVRVFILFHDCVHGSFVRSQRVCRVIGRVLGLLVFTPFEHWRQSHVSHHASAGDLDRRGMGDVWTLTTDEYWSSHRLRRLMYRVFRNPVFMLGFGPIVSFLIAQRIPPAGGSRQRRRSVVYTNLAIVCVVVAAALTVGVKSYLLVQLPLIFVAGVFGIWLFYVQHQFEPSYWTRREAWNAVDAALRGSSYYRLPRVLQWFSGNIGLHHLHHLRPKIPNYRLQPCLDATPELNVPSALTLWGSLRCLRLNLWDEQNQSFVSFREARRRRERQVVARPTTRTAASARPVGIRSALSDCD